MGIKVNLTNVATGWLNVFERGPDSVDKKTGQTKRGKYAVTGFLPYTGKNARKLEAAAREALMERLKSEKAVDKWMEKTYGEGNHDDKCMVRDLAERDKPIEGFEGGLYFQARNSKQPLIVTSEGEEQTKKGETINGDDIEGREVYPGCVANLSLEVYYYEEFKTLMVNILGIKFKDDGKAFGGSGETASRNDLDDDEDDDAPRKSKRRSRDEDDEDENPRRSKRRRDEDDDDEEEERPRKSKRRSRDEDDE